MAGLEVCNIFARTVFPRCSWSIYSSIWENNCDERHPLHYQATEKAEKACTALLKLFDAYTPLKETEAAAQRSDAELTAYKKAQALQFIAKITKRVHDKNEKEIRSIAAQIEELSSGLERGLLDVDAAASEQAVYIKKLLSRARRARSKVKARWDLLDENGNYAFSSTTDSFADLQHFSQKRPLHTWMRLRGSTERFPPCSRLN